MNSGFSRRGFRATFRGRPTPHPLGLTYEALAFQDLDIIRTRQRAVYEFRELVLIDFQLFAKPKIRHLNRAVRALRLRNDLAVVFEERMSVHGANVVLPSTEKSIGIGFLTRSRGSRINPKRICGSRSGRSLTSRTTSL